MKGIEIIAASFLKFARHMRDEGKTDREIQAAFRLYAKSERVKTVVKKLEAVDLSVTIEEGMIDIRSTAGSSFDTYKFLCGLGVTFATDYKIGKYTVQFLIEDGLIFEVKDSRDLQRIRYLESLGFRYVSTPQWYIRQWAGVVSTQIKNELNL